MQNLADQRILRLHTHKRTHYIYNQQYVRLNYLVNKRMIHEVWSPNAQVEYIDFLHNSIVECIEKP